MCHLSSFFTHLLIEMFSIPFSISIWVPFLESRPLISFHVYGNCLYPHMRKWEWVSSFFIQHIKNRVFTRYVSYWCRRQKCIMVLFFLHMSAAYRFDQKYQIPQLNYKLILDFPELTRRYTALWPPNGHSQLVYYLIK